MSKWAELYRAESGKPVWQFVADLKEAGLESHMVSGKSHGVDVTPLTEPVLA